MQVSNENLYYTVAIGGTRCNARALTHEHDAMAITQADHNDMVDRASIVVWLGVFALVAVLLYAVAILLFFPTTGTNFALALTTQIGALIVAVFAIWFATPSLLAINIFRLVAFIYVVLMFVIFIVELVFFINNLRGNSTADTSQTAVLIDVLRQTFIFVVTGLFFGLAVAFYVMGTHYATGLERQAVIEKEIDAWNADVEPDIEQTPGKPATFTAVRHRVPTSSASSSFGVVLNGKQ